MSGNFEESQNAKEEEEKQEKEERSDQSKEEKSKWQKNKSMEDKNKGKKQKYYLKDEDPTKILMEEDLFGKTVAEKLKKLSTGQPSQAMIDVLSCLQEFENPYPCQSTGSGLFSSELNSTSRVDILSIDLAYESLLLSINKVPSYLV